MRCSTRARTEPLLQKVATDDSSAILNLGVLAGAPGRIRTRDPLLRRQPLYPTELQAPDNLLCRAKVTRRTQSRAGLVALRSWPRTILSQLRGREPGQSAQSGPGCLRSWGDRRQNDRYPPARLKGPPVKGGLLVAGTTSDAGKSLPPGGGGRHGTGRADEPGAAEAGQ